MKIATNDNDNYDDNNYDDNNGNHEPLDPSEPETLRQREAGHGEGPATNRVRFFGEVLRFPITVVGGSYVVDDNGQWLRHCPESTL